MINGGQIPNCTLPQHHQLPDMVGVVVDDEQGFAEEGLAIAVGDFGEEVVGGVGDEVGELFVVFMEGGDAFVPRGVGGRCGVGRPIGFGPLEGRVAGVA